MGYDLGWLMRFKSTMVAGATKGTRNLDYTFASLLTSILASPI